MVQTVRQEVPERLEPVKRAYDSLAPTYDRRWRTYIDVSLARVLSALSLEGQERILDVACGTGELERRLLARWPGLHVTGVDLCPKMLAQAEEKHVAGDVTWIEGDAANLPVPDGEFDAVVCANSFHFFRQPMDCLREFRRCLVPTGRLVLVDWCDDYWTCKLCSLWLRLTDPAFFCTYTMRACREMLVDAGFDVVRSERFKVSWLWGMMLFECGKGRSAEKRVVSSFSPFRTVSSLYVVRGHRP
jgi:ubiquinone/menaquinone biosynthesis C-methylase UbiE